MAHPITGIDHALVGVRDLESARARYARLGFTTCPRGRHIGWGTANYCIMFARDYVELIGIVEPSEPSNNLDRFLESREGLMGLAWASGDAAEAKRTLAARGIAADGPRDLARRLELDDGTVEPAFKLVHLRPAASPAYRSFVCQHLTPGLMRRADWLTHANGARAIRDATAVVEEPTAVAPAYAAPVRRTGGGDRRRLGGAGRPPPVGLRKLARLRGRDRPGAGGAGACGADDRGRPARRDGGLPRGCGGGGSAPERQARRRTDGHLRGMAVVRGAGGRAIEKGPGDRPGPPVRAAVRPPSPCLRSASWPWHRGPSAPSRRSRFGVA